MNNSMKIVTKTLTLGISLISTLVLAKETTPKEPSRSPAATLLSDRNIKLVGTYDIPSGEGTVFKIPMGEYTCLVSFAKGGQAGNITGTGAATAIACVPYARGSNE
jgi:hypothetical protein